MSSQPSGGQERTEKATPQRMKKVRAEGNLGRSQDLSAWLVVGAAVATIPMVLGRATQALHEQTAFIGVVANDPDPARAADALGNGLQSVISVLAPLFTAAVLAAIIGSAVQGGIHVATKKFKPDFKRLNPIKGFKRILGPQAWWQGAKALLKTAAVGSVLYLSVAAMMPLVQVSGALSLRQMLMTIGDRASTLVWSAVAAGLALAAADVVVVMRRNRKQTRMTKREVKDEHKNTEGDPQIKGAIRAKQLAMSRNRMIATMTDADVVVVNPTHVAVALRYEPGSGPPKVLAKGRGHVAARIRERALDLRIPIVQDVQLARALEAACDLGQEIPRETYEAVARVLAFVMSLRRRGAAAGTHRMPDPLRKDG